MKQKQQAILDWNNIPLYKFSQAYDTAVPLTEKRILLSAAQAQSAAPTLS